MNPPALCALLLQWVVSIRLDEELRRVGSVHCDITKLGFAPGLPVYQKTQISQGTADGDQ